MTFFVFGFAIHGINTVRYDLSDSSLLYLLPLREVILCKWKKISMNKRGHIFFNFRIQGVTTCDTTSLICRFCTRSHCFHCEKYLYVMEQTKFSKNKWHFFLGLGIQGITQCNTTALICRVCTRSHCKRYVHVMKKNKLKKISNIFFFDLEIQGISQWSTGWRRLIGSPKLQIIFHKRATKYMSLLWKMTYKDKGSYESSPPCTTSLVRHFCTCTFVLAPIASIISM